MGNNNAKTPVTVNINQKRVQSLEESEKRLSLIIQNARSVIEAQYGLYLWASPENAEDYVLSKELFNLLNMLPAKQIALPESDGDFTEMSLEDIGVFHLETMKAKVLNVEARISRLSEIAGEIRNKAYLFIEEANDSHPELDFAYRVMNIGQNGPMA